MNNKIIIAIPRGRIIDECKNFCSANENCYGFSYPECKLGMANRGTNVLKENIIHSDAELYLKLPTADVSACPKVFTSITSKAWDNYQKGDTMTSDTLCGISKIINDNIDSIKTDITNIKTVSTQMYNKIDEHIKLSYTF